ncbi:Acyl-CoA synthetase member 2 mitochondrial, partial [Branchiostoma belcheri]
MADNSIRHENSPLTFLGYKSDSLETKCNTIGQPFPHVEVKIVDKNGEVTPLNEPGELCTRGHGTMHGYWDDLDKTAEVIGPDRWYRTGDVAVLDEQGYGRIVGRIQDLIIRGGENIYPREIEEFLHTHPKVEDVQVIGVPDERMVEEVCAWIKLKEGEILGEDDVKTFCKGQPSVLQRHLFANAGTAASNDDCGSLDSLGQSPQFKRENNVSTTRRTSVIQPDVCRHCKEASRKRVRQLSPPGVEGDDTQLAKEQAVTSGARLKYDDFESIVVFSKMSSKKLVPNDEAAPEGSVGRHGNQRTLGISMTPSGLASVVSFIALLFMLRELASIRDQQTAFMRGIRDQQTAFMRGIRDQQTAFMREIRDQQTAFMREIRDQQTAFMREIRDQQTAFMREIRDQQTAFMREIRDQQMTTQTDLQGLKDQVLQMQLRQENKAKDKGPAGSTEDWRRDDSATFWKSAEAHRRAKRNSEAKTVLILGKRSDFRCLSGPLASDGPPQVTTPAAPTAPPQVTTPAAPTAPPHVTTQATTTPAPIDTDCAAYKAAGHTTSGVYTLGPPLSGVEVYCDMHTAGGGWTVIQRRQDGSVLFNKNWEEYKHGFGNKNGEYWLGNEKIHRLTAQKDYSLRIDMVSWDFQTRYAEYHTFRVSGESDQYRLTISGYSGTAGDSMVGTHSLNGQMFSTVDRDNDAHPSLYCSENYGGGGWWQRACSLSLLNGRYLGYCGNSCPAAQGV